MFDQPSNPTVLVHLSDIHFSSRHDDGPLDVESGLRRAIEQDLQNVIVPEIGSVAGILVTGDVAHSGRKEQYATAVTWLRRLCEVTGCSWPNVWTVPGNHDVNQDVIRDSPGLQDLHKAIRETTVNGISDKIIGYLRDSTFKEAFFLPIEEYNLFAGTLGSEVSPDKPFWNTEFPLNDGYKLRVRGMTSTLISGLSDNNPAKQQVLGEFQASIPDEVNIANLVMSHHPPSWLRDGRDVETALKACAQIHLFGHEHDQGVEGINGRCVRVYAGAVHPSRTESRQESRYNVLAIRVSLESDPPCLEAVVYPRIWSRTNRIFQADFRSDGSNCEAFRLPLGRRPTNSFRRPAFPSAHQEEVEVRDAVNALPQATGVEENVDPMRHLRYRFLTLPFGIQIQIAQTLDLFLDEDRGIKDPELFRRVSRRAVEEDKLSDLWDAVEARNMDGPPSPNPFGVDTQRSP